MKKLFITGIASLIVLSVNAQEFTNYYTGYLLNFSVVADDSLVYVGCDNAINVFYKNGSFKEIIHVNGSVFSSVKDKSGNLWFAVMGIFSSQSGGVIKCDGVNWDFIPVDNGFVERGVNAITCDTNNNIWVTINPYNSNSQAIIAKYNGTEWTNYTTFGDTITLSNAEQIVCDSDNIIYAGIYYGIIAISETDTTIYNYTNSGIIVSCTHSSLVDRNNNVWFGGHNSKPDYFNGESWHQESGVPGSGFYAIFQDTSKMMWFGTQKGLHVENDTGYISYYMGEEIIFDCIYDIESDKEDNIWMATNNILEEYDVRMGCLTKFDEDGFHNYFPNTHIGRPKQISFLNNKIYTYNFSPLSVFDGVSWNIDITQNELFNFGVYSVGLDNSGNTWLGTTNGLYKINNNESIEHITELCGNEISEVKCIGCLNNNVWITTNDNKFYQYDGEVWSEIQLPTGYGLSSSTRVFVRSEDDLWFTRSGNVAIRFYQDTWQKCDSIAGFLPNQYINDICFVGDSTWFATSYGAVLLYNDVLSFHCNDSVYSSGYSNLQTVQVDKNGLVWFGNRKGAMTYDGENITYILASGYTEEIYTIREDPEHNLWFCGSRAVSKYTFDNSDIENPIAEQNNLKLFPNPAQQEIYFDLPTNNQSDILEIYSTNGAIIYKQKVQTGINKINIESLPAGMYLVRIRGENLFGKIIVE